MPNGQALSATTSTMPAVPVAGVVWHDRAGGHASFGLGAGNDCLWRWTTRGSSWRDVVRVLDGLVRAVQGIHGREEVGIAFTQGDLEDATISPLRFEAVGHDVDVVTTIGRRRTDRAALAHSLVAICDAIVAGICETGRGDEVAIAWLMRRPSPARRVAMATPANARPPSLQGPASGYGPVPMEWARTDRLRA